MTLSHKFLTMVAGMAVLVAACGGPPPGSSPTVGGTDVPPAGTDAPTDAATDTATESAGAGDLDEVSLQLQWAPQAQFAGYFAAREEGFYEA
ncbi:hypothetical protein BH20CHL6_BH20CHL6_11990 [soil metagenome]